MSDLQLHWVEDENSESGYYDENTLVNKPTTRYYYDGQMMIEDDYYANAGSASSTWSVTRYGLGARGIDYIAKEDHNGPAGESFPIYDGHGNMVATLSRSGSNNFALANFRSYDVWGSVRQQNTVDSDGGPKQKYCANLGHVQDDESDLIYMRARYYEPGVGGFVNQDPSRDSWNWFVYCNDNPTNKIDFSGQIAEELLDALWNLAKGAFVGGGKTAQKQHMSGEDINGLQVAIHSVNGMVSAAIATAYKATFKQLWSNALTALRAGMARGEALPAIIAAVSYSFIIFLFIIKIDFALDGIANGIFGWK